MTHKEEILGATFLGVDSTRFIVWAPNVSRVELHLLTPNDGLIQMQAEPRAYFHAVV